MPKTIDGQSQELLSNISPANTTEDIIAGSPEELKKMIEEDYKEDINTLSPDKQKMLLEKWKNEVPKNILIFERVLGQIKELNIESKELNIESKEDIQNKQTSEKLETASSTAKKALEFSQNIEKVVGKQYQGDIQSSIQSDIQSRDTQVYFESLGIDLTNKDILSKPETQNILLARASVRVYTDKQAEIIDKHPKLKGNLDNLDSLRFSLGIKETSTAKNISSLLIDQPKSDREAITSTVKTLTRDSPDTMITRTGDRLTFSDPKNERYTYDIDMSKRPLELSKQLNGLTISRELGETRDPIREKNTITKNNSNPLKTGISIRIENITKQKLKDGTDVIPPEMTRAIIDTNKMVKLDNFNTADFSKSMIKGGLAGINIQKNELKKLLNEKIEKDRLDPDIGTIGGVLREIDEIIESFNKLEVACANIKKEDPKNNNVLWEEKTDYTLGRLVSLGFDNLEQENLNTLIKTISEQNGKREIWESGKLDITGKKLEQQLDYLEATLDNLTKKSKRTKVETLQDIRNSIKDENFRGKWENGTFIAGFLPNKDIGNNSTVTAQNTTEKVGNKPL